MGSRQSSEEGFPMTQFRRYTSDDPLDDLLDDLDEEFTLEEPIDAWKPQEISVRVLG